VNSKYQQCQPQRDHPHPVSRNLFLLDLRDHLLQDLRGHLLQDLRGHHHQDSKDLLHLGIKKQNLQLRS
jgi:hypothetical protein